MDYFDGEHIYRRNGIQYTPVSEFLQRFKPQFPAGKIAQMCAPKEGRTPEEVLAKWDLNKQISCNYGTAIHQGIEYWIRYGEFSKLPHIRKAVEAFAKKFKEAKLHPEVIVYSDEYRLAGTIDQIVSTGPKKVRLLDVKTNGELTDKPKGKFLPPLESMPFSKINEYRLQLSVYKHLLELKGITVEGIALEHFDGAKFKTIELKPINVTNLCQTLSSRKE